MIKKHKKDLIIFIVIFLFSIIMCNEFIKMHYTTDTYKIIDDGYMNYARNWSMKDGRIFTCMILVIAYLLRIPIQILNYILTILSIIVSCISVMNIIKIICKIRPVKTKSQEICIIVISYLTIFNFMYIETLYFLENIILSMSVLLYIIAIKNILFESKKYIIKSILLCILGILCYQGTISFFLVFAVSMLIIKENIISQKFIKKFLLIGFISVIAVLLDMIVVKEMCKLLNLEQNRLQLNNVINNCGYILKNMKDILIFTCGIFPKYMFIIGVLLLDVISLIYSIHNKTFEYIGNVILINISTIVFSFIPFTATLSSFDCARMYVGLGSLEMIIIIYQYCDTDIFQNKDHKKICWCIEIFIFISLIINSANYIIQINYVQYKNKLEKNYCMRIEKFLKDNSVKINYASIIPVKGKMNEIYFDEIPIKNKMTINEIKGYQSAISGLNVNTGLKLKEKKYISNKENVEITYIPGTSTIIIDDVLIMQVFIW